MIRVLIFLFLCGAALCAHATCFEQAASQYGLPEDLLRAIAKVESSNNPAAVNLTHLDRTKTYDIGLMQINSSWLPKLEKMGISEAALREPCQNVLVGAWILHAHMKQNGFDWNGVGSYNASCTTKTRRECEDARNTYSWKVYRALLKVRGGPNFVMQRNSVDQTASSQSKQPRQRLIRTISIEDAVIASAASADLDASEN